MEEKYIDKAAKMLLESGPYANMSVIILAKLLELEEKLLEIEKEVGEVPKRISHVSGGGGDLW